VTDDVRKTGIRGWTEKARNTDQWRLIVKEAKAHPGLQRRAEEEDLPYTPRSANWYLPFRFSD
jgi:hypothetical protein